MALSHLGRLSAQGGRGVDVAVGGSSAHARVAEVRSWARGPLQQASAGGEEPRAPFFPCWCRLYDPAPAVRSPPVSLAGRRTLPLERTARATRQEEPRAWAVGTGALGSVSRCTSVFQRETLGNLTSASLASEISTGNLGYLGLTFHEETNPNPSIKEQNQGEENTLTGLVCLRIYFN